MKRPSAPTRRETVKGVARELETAPEDLGIESPRVEAERLVCHVLGLSRAELVQTGDRTLAPAEAGRLARVVRRRLAGEPVQHIEGTVEFRELRLLADRRAFIPRPETEELVGRIVRWARGRGDDGVTRKRREGDLDEGPAVDRALDIGTGSGAIALSLVVEGVARHVVGLDVSAEALVQAAANRDVGGVPEDRVEFRVASRPIWESVGREERFDLIVSNPPYVADDELEELSATVREHEPREALAGGPDGLDVIREIASKAAVYLRPGGALFLEIGADQADAVLGILSRKGPWEALEVERDLAGRERFVRAVVPG